MSWLPTALMVVGTTMSAVSTYQQAKAASDAAKYNAELARQQAETIEKVGELEKEKLERRKRQILGQQRAAYAQAGVRVGSGSPLEVMADTAAQIELDIAAQEYNTRIGISRARTKAEIQEMYAKQYKRAGLLGAGSTLLTGYGQAFNVGYGKAKNE